MVAVQDVTKLNGKDLHALVAQLQQENDRLKKERERKLSLKVSAKGALSLYGIGRFPVTLYQTQWLRVLDMADTIRQFIQDNKDKLATKD
jgi:hypothetical protein